MIKTRCFPESNYKGIYYNGKTIRVFIDPKQPITELQYPEFYDIKITGKCNGGCSYCYMSSSEDQEHYNAIENIKNFFGNMTENQRPFQVAIGGGEPTLHPDFTKILKTFYDLGIAPNYTTNGSFVVHYTNSFDSIIRATKQYCQGVAITCHKHLDNWWYPAADLLTTLGVFTNLHILISDKESVDEFVEIYNEWKGKIKYFVLLPKIAQGRCKETELDWNYLESILKQYSNIEDVAFGANLYPYLKQQNNFKLSLYEPELLSGFLDLKDMKFYKSSFNLTEK